MDNPSAAEFDARDAELLAQAQRESEVTDAAAVAKATGEPPVAAPAAPAPVAATPVAETPVAAPAEALAPVAPKAESGSVAAALRASRHAERVARERAEALAREIEELKAKAGATAATTAGLPPEMLADLDSYAPQAAARMRELEAENLSLKNRPAAPAPAPGFSPQVLSEEQQGIVDTIPDLLEWQITAGHQDRWEAAKATDGVLSNLPGWKDKPLAERFAEAVRRVKVELADPAPSPAPATLADAERVIAAAAAAAKASPVAIGDLRGGIAPDSKSIPDYREMTKTMSDEDIIASLPP